MSDYGIVVIGGSAGSFSVISRILSGLREGFQLPVVVCMHRLKHVRSGFVESLSERSRIPVSEPRDKDRIEEGRAYMAPANYHLFLEFDGTFSLSVEAPHIFCRPAIDHTLTSAAQAYRSRCVGVLLTGANADGAQGMKDIADRGGLTIVQDPASAEVPTMPNAALRIMKPSQVLDPQGIIDFLNKL